MRYVIDFYKGASLPNPTAATGTSASAQGPGAGAGMEPAMSIYLDVRPALDSFTALKDRVTVFVVDTWRNTWKSNSSDKNSDKTNSANTSSKS